MFWVLKRFWVEVKETLGVWSIEGFGLKLIVNVPRNPEVARPLHELAFELVLEVTEHRFSIILLLQIRNFFFIIIAIINACSEVGLRVCKTRDL